VCLLRGTDWFLWLALVWIFSRLTSQYRQNAIYNSPQRIYTIRCHFQVQETYLIHYRTILKWLTVFFYTDIKIAELCLCVCVCVLKHEMVNLRFKLAKILIYTLYCYIITMCQPHGPWSFSWARLIQSDLVFIFVTVVFSNHLPNSNALLNIQKLIAFFCGMGRSCQPIEQTPKLSPSWWQWAHLIRLRDPCHK
jgi:hypothetical protein